MARRSLCTPHLETVGDMKDACAEVISSCRDCASPIAFFECCDTSCKPSDRPALHSFEWSRKYVPICRWESPRGSIRTNTCQILNPVPLPLGYTGSCAWSWRKCLAFTAPEFGYLHPEFTPFIYPGTIALDCRARQSTNLPERKSASMFATNNAWL